MYSITKGLESPRQRETYQIFDFFFFFGIGHPISIPFCNISLERERERERREGRGTHFSISSYPNQLSIFLCINIILKLLYDKFDFFSLSYTPPNFKSIPLLSPPSIRPPLVALHDWISHQHPTTPSVAKWLLDNYINDLIVKSTTLANTAKSAT